MANEGSAIQFADDSFKKDQEIVFEAIKQYGSALEYVDDKFKNKEIVLEAVKKVVTHLIMQMII